MNDTDCMTLTQQTLIVSLNVTSPEFWVRFIDILFWYCLWSVFLVVLPGNVASVIVPAAAWWFNG